MCIRDRGGGATGPPDPGTASRGRDEPAGGADRHGPRAPTWACRAGWPAGVDVLSLIHISCFTSSSATLQLLADLEPGDHERMLIMALRGLAETLTRLGNTEEADKATTRADTLEEEYPNPDD